MFTNCNTSKSRDINTDRMQNLRMDVGRKASICVSCVWVSLSRCSVELCYGSMLVFCVVCWSATQLHGPVMKFTKFAENCRN